MSTTIITVICHLAGNLSETTTICRHRSRGRRRASAVRRRRCGCPWTCDEQTNAKKIFQFICPSPRCLDLRRTSSIWREEIGNRNRTPHSSILDSNSLDHDVPLPLPAIVVAVQQEGRQRTMAEQRAALLPIVQCVDGQRSPVDIAT